MLRHKRISTDVAVAKNGTELSIATKQPLDRLSRHFQATFLQRFGPEVRVQSVESANLQAFAVSFCEVFEQCSVIACRFGSWKKFVGPLSCQRKAFV
jgi:hypothetical protein